MIVPIKILATLFVISLVVGLLLAIVFNWDEESRRKKRLEKALERSGLISMALIGLTVLTYGIDLIWF